MEERPFSDSAYERFLNEEKLMGSRCKECGALFVPPRPICAKCNGSEMRWTEVRGKGKLRAFTCIAVVLPLMMEEGFDRKHPYCCGVIELEEGVRVVARIEEVDTTRPENIKVGMSLTAKFLHRGEGGNVKTFLAFKPL